MLCCVVLCCGDVVKDARLTRMQSDGMRKVCVASSVFVHH